MDRTEEMQQILKELEYERKVFFDDMALKTGRFFMFMSAGPLRRRIFKSLFAKIGAFFLVEKSFLGVEPGKKSSVIDVASNWLRLPSFTHMDMQISEADDERVVVVWPFCPLGFPKNEEGKRACRMSVSLDAEQIKRLGGKLIVTDTVLEGFPECRFTITCSNRQGQKD